MTEEQGQEILDALESLSEQLSALVELSKQFNRMEKLLEQIALGLGVNPN
jgi:hypothetical protein